MKEEGLERVVRKPKTGHAQHQEAAAQVKDLAAVRVKLPVHGPLLRCRAPRQGHRSPVTP